MITVAEALKQISEGKDFDSLSEALMDLSPIQATSLPSHSPYSIATVVFHMWFWQDRWINQIADIHCEPFTGDDSDFVEIAADDWIAIRDQFFDGYAHLQNLAQNIAVFEKPTQFGDTVEGLLVRSALHTAYHVGQVVLLRRMIQ